MKLLVVISILMVLVLGAVGLAQAEPVADKSGTFSVEVAKGWSQSDSEDLISMQGPQGIAQITVTGEEAEGVTLSLFDKVFVAQIKKELKKFKLVSHAKTKINGSRASLWIYTGVIDGVTLKFKNVVTIKNGSLYNVVFATLPDRFKSDAAGVDKLLSSWKWL